MAASAESVAYMVCGTAATASRGISAWAWVEGWSSSSSSAARSLRARIILLMRMPMQATSAPNTQASAAMSSIKPVLESPFPKIEEMKS